MDGGIVLVGKLGFDALFNLLEFSGIMPMKSLNMDLHEPGSPVAKYCSSDARIRKSMFRQWTMWRSHTASELVLRAGPSSCILDETSI